MINNALLQMAARGGRSTVPDAFARGAQQGNALRQFQQEQEKHNALAQIAQAYAQGGPEAAAQIAGQTGQYDAVRQLDQTQYKRGRDQVGDQRFERQFDYRQGRDQVGDQFRNKQFDATQDYRGQTLGLQRQRLTAAQRAAEQKGQNPAANFESENKLRKDFQSITKEFRDVRDAHGRIKASVQNPSPAGDLSLIFNYMKMLDPGSVVRESEFATAAASGSYGERIKAAVGNVTSGQRLSPAMRTDFVSRADQLFQQRQGQYGQTEQQFKGLAQQYGFDGNKVVLDFNASLPKEADRDLTGGGGDLKSKYGLE